MNAASPQTVVENRSARRTKFIYAICLFALWLGGLVTLVVTTSNPVTLNVAQLRDADSVVVATLTDAAAGEFELVDTIAGIEPPASFQVQGIADVSGPESNRWLLPLYLERDGNFSIVPVPYRDKELLLVYPATDDVVAEANALVGGIVD